MIELIWAPPSEGKSYCGTERGVRQLLENRYSKFPRKVYSNYPIVYHIPLSRKQKILNLFRRLFRKPVKNEEILSSLEWQENYIYMGIQHSLIILDEAYRYKGFSSRHKMNDDQHSFFATTGHDDNNIILIAQHYNRLELIFRENANIYTYIRKYNNPFSRRNKEGDNGRVGEVKPLFFKVDSYISEDDFRYRKLYDTVWKSQRLWFNIRVSNAYDTKRYRKPQKEFTPRLWTDIEKDIQQEIKDNDQKQIDDAVKEFTEIEI